MRQDKSPSGFIYAIQSEHVHLIKLGFSAEPSARLHDLKTGSPVWRGTVADEEIRIETPAGEVLIQLEAGEQVTILRYAPGSDEPECVATWDLEPEAD